MASAERSQDSNAHIQLPPIWGAEYTPRGGRIDTDSTPMDEDTKKQVDIGDAAVVDRSDYSDHLGYEKASYIEARKHYIDTSIRTLSKKRYSLCVNISEFGRYGVGLFLYFKFLKWMAIMYSIMSVLMLFSLSSNLVSGYLTT